MGLGRKKGPGDGGAALNFKVVPGLTQPGTASENTIWVKTESLTGWYFAATQPENMQEGEVWFPTGTESAVEFNALKKNSLQVYPLSAKQMISGALVDVEAMSYQGGEWIEWWNGELFENGKQFENITGGWGLYPNNGQGFEAGSINANGIMIIDGKKSMSTEKKISKGEFSRVCINVLTVKGTQNNRTCMIKGDRSDYTNMFGLVRLAAGLNYIELDGITEPFYVEVYAYTASDGFTVDRIRLE